MHLGSSKVAFILLWGCASAARHPPTSSLAIVRTPLHAAAPLFPASEVNRTRRQLMPTPTPPPPPLPICGYRMKEDCIVECEQPGSDPCPFDNNFTAFWGFVSGIVSHPAPTPILHSLRALFRAPCGVCFLYPAVVQNLPRRRPSPRSRPRSGGCMLLLFFCFFLSFFSSSLLSLSLLAPPPAQPCRMVSGPTPNALDPNCTNLSSFSRCQRCSRWSPWR